MEVYRRLAEVEPEAYLPGLANSLSNLGTRLSAVGDIRGALKPSWEAVEIHRRLAQANPVAHLSTCSTPPPLAHHRWNTPRIAQPGDAATKHVLAGSITELA